MRILDKAAKRLTTFQNLSSITMADEVFESVNRITSDTYQGSMKRFANGLERLFGLIYQLEARKTELLNEHVAADLLKKELPELIQEN